MDLSINITVYLSELTNATDRCYGVINKKKFVAYLTLMYHNG